MAPLGKPPCLVFFDLSSLEPASLAAFLEELAIRQSNGAFPDKAPCHWIIDARTFPKFMAKDSPSSVFLRERERLGDAFFPVNLCAQDWNHLFPDEALRDAEETLAALGADFPVFLRETPHRPSWITRIPHDLLLIEKNASSETFLSIHKGEVRALPMAREGTGVHWMVPASVLLSPLPPRPWHSLGALSHTLHPQLHPLPELSPTDKLRLHKTAELRKEAPNKASLKRIFYVNKEYPGLGTKEAVDFEETLGGIRKRSLVSSMQGTSDMKEAGFAIRFQGGHLARITSRTGELLCAKAESYLVWRGKKRFFTTNSAFTLEGDFSFGLRESLILRDEDLIEPARMIIDYYFVEESPEFFASVTVRWPRWKEEVLVSAWAPLELTLFPLKSKNVLSCRSLWPDGTPEDSLLDVKKAQGVLNGTDFLFSNGPQALIVGFPQNQTPRPHRLFWSLKKRGPERCLTVNPEGGSQSKSSKELDGIEEHFSFYLSLPESSKLPFVVTRKQASELIPPYVKPADGDSSSS